MTNKRKLEAYTNSTNAKLFATLNPGKRGIEWMDKETHATDLNRDIDFKIARDRPDWPDSRA
jgi:hypothetical protein